MSFKGLDNGAIRYDFLLVSHCNYVSSPSCTVNDILSLISDNLKKPRHSKHIPFGGNLSCMCSSTPGCQSAHKIRIA